MAKEPVIADLAKDTMKSLHSFTVVDTLSANGTKVACPSIPIELIWIVISLAAYQLCLHSCCGDVLIYRILSKNSSHLMQQKFVFLLE